MMTANRIRKSRGPAVLLLSVLTAALISCDNPTESKNTKGSIRGSILSGATNLAVGRPAWVFQGDKLLASADSTGAFSIPSLAPGTYTLTGAALNHRDTVLTVEVGKGSDVLLDFTLSPDDVEKRAIGEFQNAVIFRSNPAWADSSAKAIYDRATGATIQQKEPLWDWNEKQVFVGDSLLDIDDWGQYSFRLKANTIPLRGHCPGYKDQVVVVKLSSENRIVVNLYMEPEG